MPELPEWLGDSVFPQWEFPMSRSKVPVLYATAASPNKIILSSESFLLIGLIEPQGPFCYITWRKAVLPAAARLSGFQVCTANPERIMSSEMNRRAMSTQEPLNLTTMPVRVVTAIVRISHAVEIGGKSG